MEGHVKVQLRHRREVGLSILGGAFCPQVDFFVLLLYRLSKQICKVVLMYFPDVRGMSQGTTIPSADNTHSCSCFGGYETDAYVLVRIDFSSRKHEEVCLYTASGRWCWISGSARLGPLCSRWRKCEVGQRKMLSRSEPTTIFGIDILCRS